MRAKKEEKEDKQQLNTKSSHANLYRFLVRSRTEARVTFWFVGWAIPGKKRIQGRPRTGGDWAATQVPQAHQLRHTCAFWSPTPRSCARTLTCKWAHKGRRHRSSSSARSRRTWTTSFETSMVSGLTEQVAHLASARNSADTKLKRVGAAFSEVRERLSVAEGCEKERMSGTRSASIRYWKRLRRCN